MTNAIAQNLIADGTAAVSVRAHIVSFTTANVDRRRRIARLRRRSA